VWSAAGVARVADAWDGSAAEVSADGSAEAPADSTVA
jgi:hypothetical protein